MEIMLLQLGFKSTYFVQGRYSIADLYKPNERCGIYVLHFANGQYYVGLAVDVVRRFNQHRQHHTDIERISFKRVKESNLSDEEKNVIYHLEDFGAKLRNIQLVSIVEGETDLSLVISEEAQRQFFTELNFNSFEGSKLEIAAQREKYSKHFKAFEKLPYAQSVIQAWQTYVKIGIPFPLKTEYTFWSLTLPSGNSLSRMNINWQEVSSFYFRKDDYWATFHMSYNPLAAVFGDDLAQLFDKYPDLYCIFDQNNLPHFYQPGGQDQIGLEMPGTFFHEFIQIEAVQKAIRTFNLRLMRKGPTIYNRYHSFDLSETVLEFARPPLKD
jgi:hypothetical protein